MEPYEFCVCQARGLLHSGELSAVELLVSVTERMAHVESKLGAFCHVDLEQARADAERCDRERAAGRSRAAPLLGIPFGVKDLIAVAGMPLRAGSEALAEKPCGEDAWSVARLRDAGAIVLGKTRTDEFAMGITTVGTRNPHDPSRIPGGSSGGSGAAVASGAVPFALGTDTGGSVRNPATLCGVLGLRPTFGRIGRTGVIPLGRSLDTVGVLGRCVSDLALVLSLLAGQDPQDPGSLPGTATSNDLSGKDVAGMRVGVVARQGWVEPVDSATWAGYESAIAVLRRQGVRTRTIDLPMMADARSILMDIILPEFAESHAATPAPVRARLGAEVRAGLSHGERLPAITYVRAQRLRQILADGWRGILADLAAVMLPGAPRGAPVIGEDPLSWAGERIESVDACFSRYTCGPSLAGLPVLSVPHGRCSRGMPVGVQVVGRPLGEREVLVLGAALQSHPVPVVP